MPLGAPITSRSNARVKALRAAFSGEARRPGERIGIEGEHLIAEALRSQLTFDTVFLREGSESLLTRPSLAGLGEQVILLAPDVFASVVDTSAPQGIAATLTIPHLAARSLSEPAVHLVLESLQDPGNLGTLLRSAEAFGIAQVFVTPETVSPWNPKAVRASAGSVFRVPVLRDTLANIAAALQDAAVPLHAAVAQTAGAVPSMDAYLLAPCALLIGNEGAGLSANALGLAASHVHIPCAVESLNAAIAGSLLMYESMRQNLLATADWQARKPVTGS